MQEFDPTLKRGVIPNLIVTPLPPGRRYTGGPVERPGHDAEAAQRVPEGSEIERPPAAVPHTEGSRMWARQPEAARVGIDLARRGRGRADIDDDSVARARALRADLERPIRMQIEAPDPPSSFKPRVRRAYATRTRTLNKGVEESRQPSYVDMEE
jgi:hypothetical protein